MEQVYTCLVVRVTGDQVQASFGGNEAKLEVHVAYPIADAPLVGKKYRITITKEPDSAA